MRRHRDKTVLAGIWLAFIARALFYCVQQPMWEGYDEWAHFAYIQHIGEHGTPPSRTSSVSHEVQRSLQLVPLSQSAATGIPGSITHDSFWKLEPEERCRREQELRMLSSPAETGDPRAGPTQYEAQQPPLYYLVLTPAYLVTKPLSLPAKVLVLRILSAAIASSVVFLGYAIASCVLCNRTLAMLVAVLLACLPGLLIDVCRIGNESLSIVLTSAVILFSLRVSEPVAGVLDWLMLGTLIGAALLTKAYTLAFLPLLPLVFVMRILRHRALKKTMRETTAGCALTFCLTTAIAGWWYWGSWVTTGTLSGEQLDVAAMRFTLSEKLSSVSGVNWRAVVDCGAFSHVWVGGWSFLVVRSWMYRVFEFVAAAAAAGVLIYMVRWLRSGRQACSSGVPGHRFVVVGGAYALMCIAVAYHSLVAHLVRDTSTALGWYLYSVIVPEVVLLALGMSELFSTRYASWLVVAVCFFAVALDLYTVHFMLIPYYTGMIAHDSSGSLAGFGVNLLDSTSAVHRMLRRLAVNETPAIGEAWIAGLWAAYLSTTISLAVAAIVIAPAKPGAHMDPTARDGGTVRA